MNPLLISSNELLNDNRKAYSYKENENIYNQYRSNLLFGNLNNNNNNNSKKGEILNDNYSNFNNNNANIIANSGNNNIHEVSLPVKIKAQGKEDWIKELTITITITNVTSSRQEINLTLTDEKDPLFHYSLIIGEQEFHVLKQEQSLLIDFQQFVSKFLEMIELCESGLIINNNNVNNNNNYYNSQSKSGALDTNYIMIFHLTNLSEGLLIVQEITRFRQLNHLILKTKSANDSVLKSYLSSKVKEYKLKSESYKDKSEKLENDINNLNEDFKNCNIELACIKEKQ